MAMIIRRAPFTLFQCDTVVRSYTEEYRTIASLYLDVIRLLGITQMMRMIEGHLSLCLDVIRLLGLTQRWVMLDSITVSVFVFIFMDYDKSK